MSPEELAEGRELAVLTPDEVIEKWTGLAVTMVQYYYHAVPAYAYDDLMQVCLIALWKASLEWDEHERVPWRSYADTVMRRAIRGWIRVERRRGLTRIGDLAVLKDEEEYVNPKVHNLKDYDEWVSELRIRKDTKRVDEIMDWLSKQGLTEKTIEVVELIARCGMKQAEVAEQLGISRQAVTQRLIPVRRLLKELHAHESGDFVC